MRDKNFKKVLTLGISSLMAISSLNLAVFANADQDDQEENNGEEINLGIDELKLNHIEEFERMRKETDEANDIKRKNFYQEKMKIEKLGNLKRNIGQKNKMLGYGISNYIRLCKKNFPDDNFRREVIRILKKNNEGHEEEIKDKEMVHISLFDNVKEIYVARKEIEDLKGIEHFVNLEKLNCEYNKLENLNIADNVKLKLLNCGKNNLANLNVANNGKLRELYCWQNNLANLNVANNGNLRILFCADNNLTELNVANNGKLETINCRNNNLSNLNVANNVKLETLNCDDNNLANLNVANNVKLRELYCSNNFLNELDVANNINLRFLDCNNNDLRELNVDGLKWLLMLHVEGNENLREIIARDCPDLEDQAIIRDEGCEIIRD